MLAGRSGRLGTEAGLELLPSARATKGSGSESGAQGPAITNDLWASAAAEVAEYSEPAVLSACLSWGGKALWLLTCSTVLGEWGGGEPPEELMQRNW